MKPSITVDFLRGILFAFVAHSCYIFGNALWTALYAQSSVYQAATAGLLLIVHLILLVGLLFPRIDWPFQARLDDVKVRRRPN